MIVHARASRCRFCGFLILTNREYFSRDSLSVYYKIHSGLSTARRVVSLESSAPEAIAGPASECGQLDCIFTIMLSSQVISCPAHDEELDTPYRSTSRESAAAQSTLWRIREIKQSRCIAFGIASVRIFFLGKLLVRNKIANGCVVERWHATVKGQMERP